MTVIPEGGPARDARGRAVTRPVVGGSSYASQDALAQPFGLGAARRATVEILWPGGVRNRFEGVRPGKRIRFPEIPCDVRQAENDPAARRDTVRCVRRALDELVAAGLLDRRDRARFLRSALALGGG